MHCLIRQNRRQISYQKLFPFGCNRQTEEIPIHPRPKNPFVGHSRRRGKTTAKIPCIPFLHARTRHLSPRSFPRATIPKATANNPLYVPPHLPPRPPPASATTPPPPLPAAIPTKRNSSRSIPAPAAPEPSAYLPPRAENGTRNPAAHAAPTAAQYQSSPRQSIQTLRPATANPSRAASAPHSGNAPTIISAIPLRPLPPNVDQTHRLHQSARKLLPVPCARSMPKAANSCVPNTTAQKFPSARRAAILPSINQFPECRWKQ